MAILTVLQYPDPRLRLKAEVVNDFGAETQRIIDDMLDTLAAPLDGQTAGAYAANQMDIQKRIVVISKDFNNDQDFVLINPEITEAKGEVFESEACMSVPDLFAPVKRAATIKAKALDRHGNPIEIEADGYLSRCIQHEIDHLDGILFIDHLSPLKRKRFEKRLKKLGIQVYV